MINTRILYERQKRILEKRRVHSIIRSIARLSRLWLNPEYSYRKKAMKRLVENSGFSSTGSEEILNSIFRELSQTKLETLLRTELGNPKVLDRFSKNPLTNTRHRAKGPGLITHIFSSNVPQPAVFSFVHGLLLKSINVGKVSSRDPGILDLYLDSLKSLDPDLAGCHLLMDPFDNATLREWIKVSNLVVAYGENRTLSLLRDQIPAGCDFIGYGQRVSFGLYKKEMMSPAMAQTLADKTAMDVWRVHQRGCLSPLVVYIEEGGAIKPRDFAKKLALSLKKMSESENLPSRKERISRQVFDFRLKHKLKLKKLKNEMFELWEDTQSHSWRVLYQQSHDFPLYEGESMIVVKGFKSFSQIKSELKPLGNFLQGVALECQESDREKLADMISELGANRICRAGQLQTPPVTWHHDGKLNLGSWVRWTDLE